MTAEDIAIRAWDANAITPGTPFMERLAFALHQWFQAKLSSDSTWSHVSTLIFTKNFVKRDGATLILVGRDILGRKRCWRRRTQDHGIYQAATLARRIRSKYSSCCVRSGEFSYRIKRGLVGHA